MCFGGKKSRLQGGDFTDDVHLILSQKHVDVVVQRTQGYSESFVAYAKRCMATVVHLSCHHSALCVAADTRAQKHTHIYKAIPLLSHLLLCHCLRAHAHATSTLVCVGSSTVTTLLEAAR